MRGLSRHGVRVLTREHAGRDRAVARRRASGLRRVGGISRRVSPLWRPRRLGAGRRYRATAKSIRHAPERSCPRRCFVFLSVSFLRVSRNRRGLRYGCVCVCVCCWSTSLLPAYCCHPSSVPPLRSLESAGLSGGYGTGVYALGSAVRAHSLRRSLFALAFALLSSLVLLLYSELGGGHRGAILVSGVQLLGR